MKTINDYAELVKEKHALNKTIAPVETDLTDASRGYHIGEQFIIDGGLFKAKTEIEQHDALVLNTNYEPADNLTEQIKNAGGGTGTDPRLDVFENNIAPVETDETDASRAYQIGEQLILNNILYDVIVPISEHDVITTTGSGANIEPAGSISAGIQTLTNEVSDISDEIADMNNVLGAKNLLNPNNSKTQTLSGITFTVNSDGSITANGTATDTVYYNVSNDVELPKGEYILNGCPSGGAIETYYMYLEGTGIPVQRDLGEGASYNFANDVIAKCYISIANGYTADNLVFKPMLRPASIKDNTYVPYSMTNREMTPYVQAVSNPNLLDNPWFTVNQRGETSVNANGEYIADRWIDKSSNDHTITRNNDGTITVTSNDSLQTWLRQTFENSIGDGNADYTLSILVTAYTGNAYLRLGDSHYNQITSAGLHILTVKPNGASYAQVITSANSSVTFRALKLEKGNVSTLANDTAPNYATELLKCQRYFVRIGKDNEYVGVGVGQARSETLCSIHIPLPIQLRAKPTITLISGDVKLRHGANVIVSTILAIDGYPNNEIMITATSTGFTAGDIYECFVGNLANNFIDLSADL